MHIEMIIDGLTYTTEIPPGVECVQFKFTEKQLTIEEPKSKTSAHRVPEGAREEKIKGVWHLFYDDTDGCACVALAGGGKFYCCYEKNLDEEVEPCSPEEHLSDSTDYAIIGDWVRSVWEAEK